MKNTIVVLINNEVWGTWTVNNEISSAQKTELSRSIRQALKDSSFPDYSYHVDFIENIDCDSISEVIEGITESIHDQFNEDYD